MDRKKSQISSRPIENLEMIAKNFSMTFLRTINNDSNRVKYSFFHEGRKDYSVLAIKNKFGFDVAGVKYNPKTQTFSPIKTFFGTFQKEYISRFREYSDSIVIN